MAVTFSAVATLAATSGNWAVQANEIGRRAAIALLAVFGVTLVSQRAAAILSRPVVALGNRLSGSREAGTRSFGGSLVLGVATGLLWAPCAGPILGVVLTGAALRGADADTVLLLSAYAAGAATSIALAVLAGGRVVAAMKRSLRMGERIRQSIGVAVLASVAAIALGLDTSLLTQFSGVGTAGIEQALLQRLGGDSGVRAGVRLAANGGSLAADRPYRSDLPDRGAAPGLDGAVTWLNSAPLAAAQLRGKVVLVDFWTYSCIDCIRTLPYLRAWAERYKDRLVVVGVHTPEFAFEKKVDNVRQAIARFGVAYPVAIDNDFKIWRAFRNHYWPALYVIDAQGRIRYTHYGEGDEAGSERAIQDVLAETADSRGVVSGVVRPEAEGAEAPADLAHIRSEETYLGYLRASGFASTEESAANRRHDYSVRSLRLNQWGLIGNWTVGPDSAVLNRAEGGIALRFSARDLHLVLGPGAAGKPVRFRVTIDGATPAADHGSDIDADGNGVVSETRLYQLVRQAGEVGERNVEIRFFDPGAEAYVFTFG